MDIQTQSRLFDEAQIRRRAIAGRCLICGVEQTDNPPVCTLQPLDIPPGTALETPHLWPSEGLTPAEAAA